MKSSPEKSDVRANTDRLLQTLFEILGETRDYFISGSLSFLPLLDNYRQPGRDVDVSIRKETYRSRNDRFLRAGRRHVLRLSEVAVANKSIVSRVLSPRTGFIHIETPDGLLDTSVYIQGPSTIDLILGLGLTLTMSDAFMRRRNTLRWHDFTYRAAPPETMFVTKAVECMLAHKDGRFAEFTQSKHFEDLKRMATIVDWEFAQSFLDSLRVCWNGRRLPESVDNVVNPYRVVDLPRLKGLLL